MGHTFSNKNLVGSSKNERQDASSAGLVASWCISQTTAALGIWEMPRILPIPVKNTYQYPLRNFWNLSTSSFMAPSFRLHCVTWSTVMVF